MHKVNYSSMNSKFKITPFLILTIVLVIYSIIHLHLFDFWTLDGGMSAIGVNAIALVIFSGIILFIDRFLLKKLKLKWIFLIEIAAILLVYFLLPK